MMLSLLAYGYHGGPTDYPFLIVSALVFGITLFVYLKYWQE